jgi:Uma2 family endonuclease
MNPHPIIDPVIDPVAGTITYTEHYEPFDVDVSHLITEDDTPVDNPFSERQQHLLVETLYTTWQPPNNKTFIALSNVGLYYGIHLPAIVPDMMLSLGVKFPDDIWEKRNRTYLTWEYGKAPELVVEIISNFKGNELDAKLEKYDNAGIRYYLVYDPAEHYGSDTVRLFQRNSDSYYRMETPIMERIGLGYTLWQGEYKSMIGTWLRWTDANGVMLPTETEYRIEAFAVAEQERVRAEQESVRAERLAEKLRAMGVNPDEF